MEKAITLYIPGEAELGLTGSGPLYGPGGRSALRAFLCHDVGALCPGLLRAFPHLRYVVVVPCFDKGQRGRLPPPQWPNFSAPFFPAASSHDAFMGLAFLSSADGCYGADPRVTRTLSLSIRTRHRLHPRRACTDKPGVRGGPELCRGHGPPRT